jgi:hypothetical protein
VLSQPVNHDNLLRTIGQVFGHEPFDGGHRLL